MSPLGVVIDPVVALAPHAGGRAEPLDPRAHLPRALGQRLRQLRGVDVAVIGVIQRAGQIVGFEEGIFR